MTENTQTHYSKRTDNRDDSKKPSWFRRLFLNNSEEKLRETIEELIEEENDNGKNNGIDLSIQSHERLLFSNILKLRDLSADDIMVPRADIIAVEKKIKKNELLKIYAETPRSRLPVYTDTMDHVAGTVHMKDFLGQIARSERFNLNAITREVPIISPAMPLLDLLLQMRETRNHMALVVDEFGGIDGLVTLGDVLESITGELDDIYDDDTPPMLRAVDENIMIADARLPIEEFEDHVKISLIEDDDDREEIDTLAGFLFFFEGRVPAQGEIIDHPKGLQFEIIEGDTRRIKLIRITKMSGKTAKEKS